MSGFGGDKVDWWKFADVPEGPTQLPSWVSDLHVEWFDGYGNSPDFKVKAREDPYAFADNPNPVWVQEGSAYVARHADGRALCHWHGGKVTEQWLSTWDAKFDDSKACMWERQKPPFWGNPWICHEWVRATTPSEGYGGRHFRITLTDGKPLVLRGPWHGGGPKGYIHVSVYDTSPIDEWHLNLAKHYNKSNTPWWARGGTFGLYITEDLFKRIFARFQPHLQLAYVHHGNYMRAGEVSLEPIRPDWDCPKAFRKVQFPGEGQPQINSLTEAA